MPEPTATEADVTSAVSTEQWRVNELRKAGDIGQADLGQAALNSGEFTRGIRAQLGVAEPVIPPEAAPGHVSEGIATPASYAAPERAYGAGFKAETLQALNEIPASLNLDPQWGGIVNHYIVEACDAFRGKSSEERARIVAEWQTQTLSLAKSMDGAMAWLANADEALKKTGLGRDLIDAGIVHAPGLQATLWNLKTAAESFAASRK